MITTDTGRGDRGKPDRRLFRFLHQPRSLNTLFDTNISNEREFFCDSTNGIRKTEPVLETTWPCDQYEWLKPGGLTVEANSKLKNKGPL